MEKKKGGCDFDTVILLFKAEEFYVMPIPTLIIKELGLYHCFKVC